MRKSTASGTDVGRKVSVPSTGNRRVSYAPFQRERYLKEDGTSSFSQALSETIHDRMSFANHLEFLNTYMYQTENARARVVNKMRDQFEEYKDCAGVVKCPIYFSEKEKGVLSLRYSPNKEYLAVGFGSGRISLYNAKEYSLLKIIIKGKENGCPVTCVRFIPTNSNIFFASTGEGIVFSYNIQKDALSEEITQENCEINTIDIDALNTRLLTGGSDNGVGVYDLNNMVLISSYKNSKEKSSQSSNTGTEFHCNRVFCVKFLPDNLNVFVSGGWDNMLKMWDVRTKRGCVHSVIGPHISGDAIDVRGDILLNASWEPKNYVHVRDLRTFGLIQNINPLNAPIITGGVYAFAAQFFANDTMNDVILLASLGFKSVDVISLSNNIILHSFVSNQSCVAVDSYSCQLVFGGANNVFNFGAFFMNRLYDYEARAEAMKSQVSNDVEEEVVEEEDSSAFD